MFTPKDLIPPARHTYALYMTLLHWRETPVVG